MSELPETWTRAVVADLIARDGVFSDGDWVESKDQDPNGSIRLLQLADIGDGVFINKSSRFINDQKFDQLRCTEVLEGDVLIARMPDPLGRACMAPLLSQRCITVVDVAIVRPGLLSVIPKWLMHFLNAPLVRQEIELQSSGTTRRRISRSNLAQLELPVPPVPEQKRIADKLDAVLARVDACRERLDRVPTILKRFRQSVLAAATSGKLTEEWREENPTKDSSKPSTLYELHEEPPFELPTSWIWIKWKDIAAKDKYSFKRGPFGSALRKEFFVSGGYKVYEQCCPINDDCSLGKYYITEEKFKELEVFQVNAGDLLISCSGVTLGRITRVPVNFQPGIINQALLKVTLDTMLIYPAFFIQFFRSQLFQRLIFENAQGSAIPNIKGVKELKELPVPLPSLFEQHEIVRRVETLFAYADRLEARYTAARAQVERLTPALLAKAFRGELVPQDPSDEPAAVLLERIRAAREAAPAKSRSRKGDSRLKTRKAEVTMLHRKDIQDALSR
jgi:type I restriction enzyme, S subunit